MPREPKIPARETAVGLPAAVRLRNVYGFVDEYGDRWHWDVGQIVRHPFVIAMLIERQAPVVVV
jgi:hypothetical protein